MLRINIVSCLFIGSLLISNALSAQTPTATPDPLFGDKQGCFIMRDTETGAVVESINAEFCKERFYPCSTFKVPLALMGFDTGVLQDDQTTWKWDGKPQTIKSWEKNQTPRSWLKDSVVWYSQRLTPLLGEKPIMNYLADFKYGNLDFSGGLTTAWLSSSLKISADEQVDFLIRLKNKKLKLGPATTEKVLNILPVEVSNMSREIAGKTGSCFSWQDPAMQAVPPFRIGWYVGYLTDRTKTQAFAMVFKDKAEKGKLNFAGLEAKQMVLQHLQKK